MFLFIALMGRRAASCTNTLHALMSLLLLCYCCGTTTAAAAATTTTTTTAAAATAVIAVTTKTKYHSTMNSNSFLAIAR